MQNQFNVTNVRSLISRRLQITFVAGLLLGIVLGWLFSGVVSAIMRFGLLALLLIPLAFALYFWWRVRSAPKSDGGTIVTWSTSGLPPMNDEMFRQTDFSRRDEDVIDLDELRGERKK